MEYYYLILAGVGSFATGCITMSLVMYRRFLNELNMLKSLQKETPAQKAEAFFKQLYSKIDFSLYENTLEAIEIERERIGADVHDDFVARLQALQINLQTVSWEGHLLSDESNAVLLTMRQTIKHVLSSFRRIIYDMLPASLENGTLDSAIQGLCINHDNTQGTKISFRSQGMQQTLTDEQKLNLYRIVQELLNNCLKHSNGWDVGIALTWTKQELKIIVKDTGKGLLEKYTNKTEKFGLSGIFLRSKRIGAKAKFNTPPIGMEFEIVLPLEEQQIDN